MELRTTRVYQDNAAAWLGGKRRALNEGGTSSSKTFSVLQLLILIAQHSKSKLITSIVSESLPHLKRGCLRDFMAIMGEDWDDTLFNHTEHIYRFHNGSIIEFFPADEPSKMRGGRRDILFINEANNIAYDAYKELDVRTRRFTFLDWNPVSAFWAHEHLMGHDENAYIHSTYLDARDVLPVEVVANIESNKLSDPNWWNVYGLGRLGKVEGLVYPYFEQCEVMPERGDEFYGLDFGYAQDPTALVHCMLVDDTLYCDELIYQRGLTNDAIAARMREVGVNVKTAEIFADSAEPKSIEEIHRFGFNVKPCPKGSDSVEFGHQRVRQCKQVWTKRSLNCIKEQRNFRYIPDKDGILTAKTTHAFSHGMDARRYALVGNFANQPRSTFIAV